MAVANLLFWVPIPFMLLELGLTLGSIVIFV